LACTPAQAPLFSFQQAQKYTKWVTEDMVEAHPSASETSAHPFQKWFYRGAGRSGWAVVIEFVDKTDNGDYRLN